MPSSWHSLYWYCETPPIPLLQTWGTAQRYTEYQPFDHFGAVYPQTFRCFAAPIQQGWTRLLIEAAPAAIEQAAQEVAKIALCLQISLTPADGIFRVYAPTETSDVYTALLPYWDKTLATTTIQAVLAGAAPPNPPAAANLGGVALETLPTNIQQMARGVSLQQAQKLMQRFLGQVPQSAAAHALVQDVWQTPHGQRFRWLAQALHLSLTPDFDTLRSAYAIHYRRQQAPTSPLFPGDADLLASVPNALAYQPLYLGRSGDQP